MIVKIKIILVYYFEPIPGVHPEAQFLALIIGMKISGAVGSDFKQQIYIGTSVRTCTNCVHLITATNEIMKNLAFIRSATYMGLGLIQIAATINIFKC